MRKPKNVLVTGGAGFIGSNFIRYLFDNPISGKPCFMNAGFSGIVVNADCLTYAANPANLEDIDHSYGSGADSSQQRYFFEKADICDAEKLAYIFQKYDIDTVVNFAAETHVDRSIPSPEAFLRTNVTGTFTLLEAAKKYWQKEEGSFRTDVLFHQVSTDEVYGTLNDDGLFSEESPYRPRSPYAASKAAADLLVMSYFTTYGFPVTVSNCSNNYGPYQFPEKFIPLMITNILKDEPLPVYGEGNNIRDWIYVEDHVKALWNIITNGLYGRKYNISAENELKNNDLLDIIIKKEVKLLSEKGLRTTSKQKVVEKIIHVKDRPGHDYRYALDCRRIKEELDWNAEMPFDEGLACTIQWYLDNEMWLSQCEKQNRSFS